MPRANSHTARLAPCQFYSMARGCCSGGIPALTHVAEKPQLGQNPRRLQLKATNFSAWQSVQRTRRKPCSSRPHFRYSSNSRRTNRGRVRPSISI
ncbi:MAG: hypothetical protein QOJ51_174 [Acidobacteriaceae bacterium]|jgi:hypothetical protein|nr:hypothetical protein [Acidobacteriaceae bacterium]